MATVEQLFDEEGDGEKSELGYWVYGTDDLATARALVIAAAPGSHSGFPRIDYKVQARRVADGKWLATVPYESVASSTANDPKPVGFSSVTIRVSSVSSRIYQALHTYAPVYAPDTAAYDFGKAIGISKDGSIEGVEVSRSIIEYTINRVVSAADITDTYIDGVGEVMDCMNSNAFGPFAIGEARLLGFTATERANGDSYDLSFTIGKSRNATDIQLGNDIVIAEKRGWDYLDIFYEDVEVTTGGVKYLATKPVMARVHQVYGDLNFAALNLPFWP